MKIRIIYIIGLLVFAFGCENAENEFADFEVQNVYFPVQYPVRTITLQEDSSIDNTIDLERAFSIGVAVGGLRSNDIDRTVNVALAPNLVVDAYFDDGLTMPVMEMPSNYYSLSSTQITIPKGSFSGTLRVELTDAFFNDPMALAGSYVIPLVIESADDSVGILRGTPANGVENGDRRVSGDWEAGEEPKDFTLFSVKYINKYHGMYLHKGQDDTLDGAGGNVVSSEVYNTVYNSAIDTKAIYVYKLNYSLK